jgi:MinD-like ATPase involved in chromosome partitioning or flagellar assembly
MTKVIMTGSFRGGTGKSTIISNLSSYLASLGMKVILIDGDIISPGVHAIFGLDQKTFSKTLTDYLAGDANIEDIVYDISEYILALTVPIFVNYLYKNFKPKKKRYQKAKSVINQI